jgi:hypothetical protein
VEQSDSAPQHIATPSITSHGDGRLSQPWVGDGNSWTSPRYIERAHEYTHSSHGPIQYQPSNNSHSPHTPFEQQHDVLSSFAGTSPGSLALDGNPAALRWFGLLANDAGQDVIQAAQYDAEPNRGPVDDGNFADGTALQRATRIVDNSPETIEASSGRVSFADNTRQPSRISERQLWQAKEVIELLPSEKVIFDNFVQHMGLWVCFSSSSRTLVLS